MTPAVSVISYAPSPVSAAGPAITSPPGFATSVRPGPRSSPMASRGRAVNVAVASPSAAMRRGRSVRTVAAGSGGPRYTTRRASGRSAEPSPGSSGSVIATPTWMRPTPGLVGAVSVAT